MALDIDWIKKKVKTEEYEFSSHADYERQIDKISVLEIEKAILEGEILEDYPNDRRGASCLILGHGEEGYPVHIVCGKTPAGSLRVITIYIPSFPKWIDPKTRGKVS